MKSTVLKVTAIGNSRGIRLPAGLLKKYRIGGEVLLEEKPDEIVLRPRTGKKLGWAETFREMARAGEDWSDMEGLAGDGVNDL